MRILVVEDDALLGDAVQAGLQQDGHAIDWVRDGLQADHALATEAYAAMVLDLGLPGLSGLDVLQRLRQRQSTLPVLILTARDTVEDVSIHSRPIKPGEFTLCAAEGDTEAVSIHSRPIKPGEYGNTRWALKCCAFQSTPDQ